MTQAQHVTQATLEVVNKEEDVGDIDVDDGTVVSGIALGVGDVTVGKSEVKKKWPAETLKEAAPTLAGQPLVVDHENDTESVVGRVTKAGYKEDVGVIYEAVLFDEELASKVENGLLEVSIRGFHPDPADMEKTENGAAIIDRLVFSNLSLVPEGASPSNTLTVGEHEELEPAELSAALEGGTQYWNPEFAVLEGNDAGERGEEDYEDEAKVDNHIEHAIRMILQSHNNRVEEDSKEDWRKSNYDKLVNLYKRAASEYDDSIKVSRATYAMSRVNSYLTVLYGGSPEVEYEEDYDLLPSEHEKSTDSTESEEEQGNHTPADSVYDVDEEEGESQKDKGREKVPAAKKLDVDVPEEKKEEFTKATFNEMYESKKKAQNRAKELGLNGFHIVKFDSAELYLPGEDHKEFLKALRDEVFEQDQASRTEQSDDPIDSDEVGLYEKVMHDHGLEPEMLDSLEELDSVEAIYPEFQDSVNMGPDTFRMWMEHPCSQNATIRPAKFQQRHLNLIEKPKEDWDEMDVSAAARVINLVTKMRSEKPADIEDGPGGCPSKWAITLMNFGYNPFDELPDEPGVQLSAKFPSYGEIDAESEWSAPDFEDFREPYNISEDTTFGELDKDMKNAIAEHFLYVEDSLPPEEYGDLKFPVVNPDGVLMLSALRSAKQFVSRADIPEEEQNKLREIINDLAKREFGKDWTEGEPAEESVDIPQEDLQAIQAEAHSLPRRSNPSLQMFKEAYRRGRDAYERMPKEEVSERDKSDFALERVKEFANLLETGLPSDDRYTEDNDLLPSNHPRYEPVDDTSLTTTNVAGFRGVELEPAPMMDAGNMAMAEAQLSGENMTEDNTEERIEELEAQVEELESRNDALLEEVETVREEYAEALAGDSPFDKEELVDKFSVEELREKYDDTEEAELADAGPAPETGDAGEAELSGVDEEDEERIEKLEAQLENYDKMGWEAAKESVEAELAELRN